MSKLKKLVLAFVLAGGEGSRLKVLTSNRSKPQMPFGKHYILSFALSNIINSDITNRAYVLTQYKQQGILDILDSMNFEIPAWGSFIRPLPAQQQRGKDWYLGSGDAVFQNFRLVMDHSAEHILIVAADHIYKFDYEQLLEDHLKHDADVTVSGMFLNTEEAASNLGVMEVDTEGSVRGFKEKPPHPKAHPGRPGECIISQGIYIFKKLVLLDVLRQDHLNEKSEHDFGKDILPKMVNEGYNVHFYDHKNNVIPGEEGRTYWRDVGTPEAYLEALLDQTEIDPGLDLYNKEWPILTAGDNQPMMKINSSCGGSLQFLAAGGTVVTSPREIIRGVLGREVRIETDTVVQDSIFFDRSRLGRSARVYRTIVEEGIDIPEDCVIGEDIEADEERDILVTESGIRIVSAGSKL